MFLDKQVILNFKVYIIYVSLSITCVLPMARRGHQTPWNWNNRWFLGPCECQELDSGLLQVLLTIEPSLQLHPHNII